MNFTSTACTGRTRVDPITQKTGRPILFPRMRRLRSILRAQIVHATGTTEEGSTNGTTN